MNESQTLKSLSDIPLPSWLLLLTISILIFVLNIDYTAVNQALLPIARDTHLNLNDLQWLLSSYVLVWGALVVPCGRMADIFGKKNSLIIGIAVFMLGSLTVALGQSIEILITGRVIQGIGGAIFTAPAYSLTFTTMPPERQGLALGIVCGFGGLGLAVGPSLAGMIIETLSWRWIFYMNIPIGLGVILGILRLAAREPIDLSQASKLNLVSVTFLALGMIIFIYSLNQMEIWGFGNIKFIGGMVLAVGLLTAFVRRDQISSFQVIPHSLMTNKPFLSTLLAIFATAYCFSMVLVLMGLYLQNTLQLSNMDSSLVFLGFTIAVGALSPFGGKLVDHYDVRLPIIGGFIIIFLATMVMTQFDLESSLPFVVLALIMAGIGDGLAFPSINTAMFKTVRSEEINTGSAIFTMAMMIGNSLGVIVSTSMVVMSGRSYIATLLHNENLTVTPAQQDGMAKLLMSAERSLANVQALGVENADEIYRVVENAFMHGFALSFVVGLVLSAIAAGWITAAFWEFKPPAPLDTTDAGPKITMVG